MLKKTKIVATISDLRCDVDFIKRLFENGMNVVRMNTAHQTFEDTLKIVNNVRQVSEKIALMIDTKGPEIRTTKSDSTITLKQGDIIKIVGNPSMASTSDILYVSYSGFVNEVEMGKMILIDDGQLQLEVIGKEKDTLICRACNEGVHIYQMKLLPAQASYIVAYAPEIRDL